MSLGVLRSVLAVAPITLAGSSCVVLDLFPDGEQGGGGSGGIGTATGTGSTDASTSSTANATASTGVGGGGVTATVEQIIGLTAGAQLTSVRFLDVAANAQNVLVVGVAQGGAGAEIGFGGSCQDVNVGAAGGTFFLARFDAAGSCEAVTIFLDNLPPPLAASVAFAGNNAKVALAGLGGSKRSILYDVQPGGALGAVELDLLGVGITDIAVFGGAVIAGGSVVMSPVTHCGDLPGFAGTDEDAFFATVGSATCTPRDPQHTEQGTGAEVVSSVAFQDARSGFVARTDHAIHAFTTSVSADEAFFEDPTLGIVDPLGSLACVSAPPRLAFGPSGDWIFGPVCSNFRVGHRGLDDQDFLYAELAPAPAFFDRPVADPAGPLLVFGGEYRGDGGPWPSEYVTGVVGAVQPGGGLLFTLDVMGAMADRSTEVTGVDVVDDGPTLWVIGNYVAEQISFGGQPHADGAGIMCTSSEAPCKPFLGKLTLSPP